MKTNNRKWLKQTVCISISFLISFSIVSFLALPASAQDGVVQSPSSSSKLVRSEETPSTQNQNNIVSPKAAEIPSDVEDTNAESPSPAGAVSSLITAGF